MQKIKPNKNSKLPIGKEKQRSDDPFANLRAIIMTNEVISLPYSEVNIIHADMKLPIQIPLVVDHIMTIGQIVGSVKNLKIEEFEIEELLDNGKLTKKIRAISGEISFQDSFCGNMIKKQVENGNVRYLSSGIIKEKSHQIEDGKVEVINGTSYRGPVVLNTKYRLVEATPTFCPKDIHCKILFPGWEENN